MDPEVLLYALGVIVALVVAFYVMGLVLQAYEALMDALSPGAWLTLIVIVLVIVAYVS